MQNDSRLRKEILFVISSMYRGGAEHVTQILSDELTKRGWSVHVLTYAHNTQGGGGMNYRRKLSILTFQILCLLLTCSTGENTGYSK